VIFEMLNRKSVNVTARSVKQPTASTAPQDADQPIALGRLLHDIARLRRQMFDAEIKPLGLTRSQFWVLSHLGRQTDTALLTQTEIADALDVGKVTLGGLIDRLEAHKLVQREPSTTDRREKFVRVTARGRRALSTASVVRPMIDNLITRGLTQRQRDEAIAALTVMRSNLVEIRARRQTLSTGRAATEALPECNEPQ
jgi:DNA-binding MarR family transcriptional regulator